jgi:acyl-CoA dehydrogenase
VSDVSELAITFSDEQALILESALGFAKENSSSSSIRALIASELGYDDAVWQRMVDLGWSGLVVPEAQGGSGLSLADAVSIVEAMGRYLLASPLLPTLLAAAALAPVVESHEGAARWSAKLATGTIASVALCEPGNGWDFTHPGCHAKVAAGGKLKLSGSKCFVSYAANAKIIVTSVQFDGAARLLLLGAEDIPRNALSREVALDETQRTYRLRLDGLTVAEENLLPARDGDIAALVRGATLLLAAEMCGGVAGAIDVTLEYLKTRKQFGKLIGSYQGLKHPLVDIYTHYELLRSIVYGAASAFAGDHGGRLVHMAKAKASDLFAQAGDRAVQFHGGFGFTYDCDAGLYLRRAIWAQAQFGDGAYHRRRLADDLLA